MAHFVPKKSVSLQVGGPSGQRYLCSKDRPVEVKDQADIVNFRSRRDALVETDAAGNPVAPVPPHGGTISPADMGLAASYRKFGAGKTQPPPDPRVVGTDAQGEKEPEMKVRRSSPKPVEPKVEEKADDPEEDADFDDEGDSDEDEDEDGGGK
jgi:hypothetical protein